MTTERFNELVNELRSASLDTLVAKNAGYSSDDDKLHNFHAGAEVMGGTAAQAAWGYATKHLVALRDKIQRNDFHDRADFLEKCQDAINYICLIWCIGNEERRDEVEKKCTGRPNITYRNMAAHCRPECSTVDLIETKCPGDCFKDAPRHDDEPACDYVADNPADYDACRACWNQPYKGEELIRHGGEE